MAKAKNKTVCGKPAESKRGWVSRTQTSTHRLDQRLDEASTLGRHQTGIEDLDRVFGDDLDKILDKILKKFFNLRSFDELNHQRSV